MTTFIEQNGTAKGEDDGAILLKTSAAHFDDSHVWSGFGFAASEDFGLGVDGVAFKDGRGEANLVPAEIDGVAGDVVDGEAGDEGEGESGVEERLAEFGAGGVIAIEVNLIGVVGEEREPGVVSGGDGVTLPYRQTFR